MKNAVGASLVQHQKDLSSQVLARFLGRVVREFLTVWMKDSVRVSKSLFLRGHPAKQDLEG